MDIVEEVLIEISPIAGTSVGTSSQVFYPPSPPSPLIKTEESSESVDDDVQSGLWLTSLHLVFSLLFTYTLLKVLVYKMNEYTVSIFLHSSPSEARISRWKDGTVEELKTFLGLLFHMGMIRMNRIEDNWKLITYLIKTYVLLL